MSSPEWSVSSSDEDEQDGPVATYMHLVGDPADCRPLDGSFLSPSPARSPRELPQGPLPSPSKVARIREAAARALGCRQTLPVLPEESESPTSSPRTPVADREVPAAPGPSPSPVVAARDSPRAGLTPGFQPQAARPTRQASLQQLVTARVGGGFMQFEVRKSLPTGRRLGQSFEPPQRQRSSDPGLTRAGSARSSVSARSEPERRRSAEPEIHRRYNVVIGRASSVEALDREDGRYRYEIQMPRRDRRVSPLGRRKYW